MFIYNIINLKIPVFSRHSTKMLLRWTTYLILGMASEPPMLLMDYA